MLNYLKTVHKAIGIWIPVQARFETSLRRNMLINLKNQTEEMQTRLLELRGYL